MARPSRYDADRRRREFVAHIANDVRLDIAARKAGIDPWRALRMVDEPEMLDLLAAARPGHWTTLREVLRERSQAGVEASPDP